MDRLHLEVFETSTFARRITRLSADRGGKQIEIFHEFNRPLPLSSDTPLDAHVLTVFLYAATIGKPLVVHGALSKTILRNLEELGLFFHRLRPHRYKRFEIIPAKVSNYTRSGDQKAIAAFSGGADSTFTALRHTCVTQGAAPIARYPLKSVLMVQGFDVDIYNFEDFQKLINRVRPLTDSLGLEIRTVRTNNREIPAQDWGDSHGFQIAACLHMQGSDCEFGLIGSSSAYDELDLSRGSSPLTDPLLSGGTLKIIHDGSGFSRTEKVAAIMQYPLARKSLKVCWAAADQSENCGRCEKCVRTHLNILAAGVTGEISCFRRSFDLDLIRTLDIPHASQVQELSNILTYAKRHNLTGPWLTALEQRISDWRPPTHSTLWHIPFKNYAARALALLALDQPAKKMWRPLRRSVLKKLEAFAVSARALPDSAVGGGSSFAPLAGPLPDDQTNSIGASGA